MIIPLVSALTFFAGVLLAINLDFEISFWVFFFSLFLLFKWVRVAIPILCFLFGIWRVDVYESQAMRFEEEFMSIKGEIVEEIDRRLDHQKITVDTEYGRVLVKISLYDEVAYGDEVELFGEVQLPSEDISGFNYANYLARYRTWLVMYDPGIKNVGGFGFSIRGFLYDFKTVLESRINKLYFEPEASFTAGLLLGSRKGMPKELADAFQRVGLTHIVAISGYNISLVIAVMFLMFSFLKLKTRVIVSSIAIFLFVILVGASAAVVRAGIMGVLTLWGLFAGRRSQVFFALLWSALVMVIWNPYILVYDVGFQLSFASTFGLLVFVPLLNAKLPKGGGAIREAFLLTLAAQIATFPFTAFHFGRLSLISPVANVLAAPFLPFAMLFSALSLIFGKFAAVFAWFHLKMVELIALYLAKLPFIDVAIPLSGFGFFLSMGVLVLISIAFYRYELVRALRLSDQEAS